MQRTIRIYGYGFGDQLGPDQRAQIKVRLDGETIYQGNVFTPGPIDGILPGSKEFVWFTSNVEWQQSLDAASRQLEITALVGNFRFCATGSDWMPIRPKNDLATVLSSGQGHFIPCYALQEEEFVYYRDSNHNVMIDGELQPRVAINEYERLGQWHWTIMQNQIFSSNVLISAGLDAPVVYVDNENPWNMDDYLIWRLNHEESA